jgi:hypothetical protein
LNNDQSLSISKVYSLIQIITIKFLVRRQEKIKQYKLIW